MITWVLRTGAQTLNWEINLFFSPIVFESLCYSSQHCLDRYRQSIYHMKFYTAIENKSDINCLKGNSMNITDQKKKKIRC